MSLPTLISASERFTDATYQGLWFLVGVPSTRRIDTVYPLTGGGDLSADRSISLVMTPTGTVAVGSDRIIAATSPLTVNGAPSTTLASDITYAINPFNGNQDGYVVANPNGIEGKFLNDSGLWDASTVSGVPSTRTLTMVPPLTIDGLAAADLSVNRTIDGDTFTNTVKGFVPASGGGTTNFLRADGTWDDPGAGINAVTLQPTTPGTADVGNFHVTGVGIADTRLVAGSQTQSGLGAVEVYTSNAGASGDGLFVQANGNDPSLKTIVARRSNGTQAAPTPTTDFQNLFSASGIGYSTSNTWFNNLEAGMYVRANGNATLGQQPSLVDVLAGTPTSMGLARMTNIGTLFESQQAVLSTTDRPMNTVDINGRLGLRPKSIVSSGPGPTYTYTILDTDPTYLLVDSSTWPTTTVLPTAVGKSGAIYVIAKVSSTVVLKPVTITATAGQLIAGATSYALGKYTETAILGSDGFNWWLLASDILPDQTTLGSDGTAIANTTVETLLPGSTVSSWNGDLAPGAIYKVRFAGNLSTTGSPTIRFKLKNSSNGIIADSGVLETPATVTGTAWTISYIGYVRNIGFTNGRVVEASLKIAAADGVMTEYSMFSTFSNPTGGPQPNYLTVQWGTADAANTILCTAMQSELSPRTAVLS